MEDILMTILICIFVICFCSIGIVFTIFICKKLILDIGEEYFDKYYEDRIIRTFVNYIVDNDKMIFSKFDADDATYISKAVYDIYLHDNWRNK